MNAPAPRDSSTDPLGVGVPLAENPSNLGIEWDAENRLIAVKESSNTVAAFTYDAGGLRASKTAGGITLTYIYDGAHIAEERKSSGGTTRYFFGDGIDDVLAKQESGSAFYYAKDHLRSVRQVMNESGDVIAAREYDAWGNLLTGGTDAGFAFTGREWDLEASLYFYRARHYDPDTGRFISEDPLGFDAGPNRYTYVFNNPPRSGDPTGLDPSWPWRVICRYDAECRGWERQNPSKPPCGAERSRCYGRCITVTSAARYVCRIVCTKLTMNPVGCWVSCYVHGAPLYYDCKAKCDKNYDECESAFGCSA